MTREDFNFTFFTPYDPNSIMFCTFICLGSDFLFKSILMHYVHYEVMHEVLPQGASELQQVKGQTQKYQKIPTLLSKLG